MIIRSLVFVVLGMPGAVFADANDGDFMGYRLGSKYQRDANTQVRRTATDNLFVTAEKPVKPADIEEVTLLTTAETLTIGYIEASSWFETEDEARARGKHYVQLLRAKYPDWELGQEGLDANLDVVEVNLNKLPYNLRLRLIEDNHNGADMWRFSMTLGWLRGAKEEQAWRNMAFTQQIAKQQENSKKLLQGADVRGL